MIDITREKLIPLANVPTLPWMPQRNGRPFAYGTIMRWARTGIGGIKLEVVSVGGMKCTTEAALLAFFERSENPNAGRTKSEDREAFRRAEAILDAAGIK